MEIDAIKWKALAFNKIHSLPNLIKTKLLKKKQYIRIRVFFSSFCSLGYQNDMLWWTNSKSLGNVPFLGPGMREWFGVGDWEDYFNQPGIPTHFSLHIATAWTQQKLQREKFELTRIKKIGLFLSLTDIVLTVGLDKAFSPLGIER